MHFLEGSAWEPHIGMGDGFEAQTLKVHMDQESPRLYCNVNLFVDQRTELNST